MLQKTPPEDTITHTSTQIYAASGPLSFSFPLGFSSQTHFLTGNFLYLAWKMEVGIIIRSHEGSENGIG